MYEHADICQIIDCAYILAMDGTVVSITEAVSVSQTQYIQHTLANFQPFTNLQTCDLATDIPRCN